jgi:hypothetical protein
MLVSKGLWEPLVVSSDKGDETEKIVDARGPDR